MDYVSIYALAGDAVENFQVHEGYLELWDASYNGLQVKFGPAHILIGAPLRLIFDSLTAPGVEQPLRVRSAPAVEDIRLAE